MRYRALARHVEKALPIKKALGPLIEDFVGDQLFAVNPQCRVAGLGAGKRAGGTIDRRSWRHHVLVRINVGKVWSALAFEHGDGVGEELVIELHPHRLPCLVHGEKYGGGRK